MAYDGDDRGGLLSAGGVLSIIVGVLEVIAGGVVVALMCLGAPRRLWLLPCVPRFGSTCGLAGGSIWLVIVGGVLVVLGIIAIAGGFSAVRRKSFGLSLGGAICALIPFNLLGLLAVIFVSLGKREFWTDE
jgi:hypothetical protein